MKNKILAISVALALALTGGSAIAGKSEKSGKNYKSQKHSGQLQQRIKALEEAVAAEAASHGTFNVDCDAGDTINEALALARSGATVNVSGTCNENVSLSRDGQRLIGAAGASINGPDASVATVTSIGRNTRVIGLTITGGSNGVTVARSSSSRVLNCDISGAVNDGVIATRAAYVEVRDSNIHNNGRNGIQVRMASGGDIHLNTIADNANYGVFVSQSSSIDLDGNTLTGNTQAGLGLFRSASASLSNDQTVPVANQKNLIEGNSNFGVRCFDNSSIRYDETQLFGTGNTGGNTNQDASCEVSGTP